MTLIVQNPEILGVGCIFAYIAIFGGLAAYRIWRRNKTLLRE